LVGTMMWKMMMISSGVWMSPKLFSAAETFRQVNPNNTSPTEEIWFSLVDAGAGGDYDLDDEDVIFKSFYHSACCDHWQARAHYLVRT
jgi:hypothetical protein